jgi:hypothetical protein
MVRTFIACCLPILCLAPLVIGAYVAGGDAGWTCVQVECWSSHGHGIGPWGLMMVNTGHMPKLLLRMTRLCRRGVTFRARFAIGFLDCMMGRALVSQGMVMIGEALITLCSASRALC